METSLYALHVRRGLHVRAEAGDRSGHGTERCWEEVCVYIWNFWACGCAVIAAERTAAQSEDAVF